jgi:hypothetical protein
MAVVITKSPSIINLDASPIVAMPTGEAAPGLRRVINDNLTANVGDSIASIYRVVRVPTNAKIKQLLLNYPTASTAGATDIGIAFSDSLTDGTQPQFSTLANPMVQITGPVDNKLFAAALVLTSARNQADITLAGLIATGGVFTLAHMNLPLWQVLVNLGCTQFTTDPLGNFDITAKLTTALTVTAGLFALQCDYVV